MGKMPVAGYPDEYLQLLVAGSEREVRLPMSHGQAVHYRQKLYMLRVALRAESHPLAATADKTMLKVYPDRGAKDSPAELVVLPYGHGDFAMLIKGVLGNSISMTAIAEPTDSGVDVAESKFEFIQPLDGEEDDMEINFEDILGEGGDT